MSENQKRKILRLDRSRTDRAFKHEESLWDCEIGRIRKLIANHVNALEEYKGEMRILKEMPR